MIKIVKRDKQFVRKPISITRMIKRFEVLDGQQVVAFRCSLYTESHRAGAIINAMIPGTEISDAEGNRYVVKEYLKKYSVKRHVFRDSTYYLVFAIQAIG